MANRKLQMQKKRKAAAMPDSSRQPAKAVQTPDTGKESDLVEDMSENLDRFETWAIANGKYILAGCVLILIGVAVFLTAAHLRQKSIEADTVKLAGAAKAEQLESVLKTISASIPGYDMAQIRLARLYAAEKKYDRAYAAYIAVAERKNEPYLSARSRLDAAYIKELAGKPAEAAAIFALAADSADIMPDLKAEGAYGAGRLFLLLKNDAAARKYLAMTDPMKTSSQVASQWGMLSQALLNRMSAPAAKKVPETGKKLPAGK